MTREEALYKVKGYLTDIIPAEDYSEVEEIIKALDQTTWIPVSERLPEDRREVLVTAYWHETYQVMMASYYGDGLWWCVPFNNCGDHVQRLKPKAWMPLPKPYKAERWDRVVMKDIDGNTHIVTFKKEIEG